jgi:hypothetical protein
MQRFSIGSIASSVMPFACSTAAWLAVSAGFRFLFNRYSTSYRSGLRLPTRDDDVSTEAKKRRFITYSVFSHTVPTLPPTSQLRIPPKPLPLPTNLFQFLSCPPPPLPLTSHRYRLSMLSAVESPRCSSSLCPSPSTRPPTSRSVSNSKPPVIFSRRSLRVGVRPANPVRASSSAALAASSYPCLATSLRIWCLYETTGRNIR